MKSIFRSRPAKAVLKGKIFFAYLPREKSNNVKKIEKILVEHGAELSFFLNKRVKCIYGYHIDNDNQRKCINASKPISSSYCSAMTVQNNSQNCSSGKLLDTMLDSDLIIWNRLSCQFRMQDSANVRYTPSKFYCHLSYRQSDKKCNAFKGG